MVQLKLLWQSNMKIKDPFIRLLLWTLVPPILGSFIGIMIHVYAGQSPLFIAGLGVPSLLIGFLIGADNIYG